MADENPNSGGGTGPGPVSFEPEPKLESALPSGDNVEFEADPAAGATSDANAGAGDSSESGGDKGAGFLGQNWREEATKYAQQATDRARSFADEGKTRATDALSEFSRMLSDAAGTVDEKLGAEYGKYARSAADSLSGFADTLKDKQVDDLFDDARELVRKSPAVAIGTAAALGFVLARLIKSGAGVGSADTGAANTETKTSA